MDNGFFSLPLCSLCSLWEHYVIVEKRIGIDIGGTFTDFVLLQDGRLTIHKLPTTPDQPARALLDGIATLGLPQGIIHGTTVATNALLEQRGARTALLTTAGFADVLVIGRGVRPTLYDLAVTRPEPLVTADLRLEIGERITADGQVLLPLSHDDLERAIERLIAADVESVAVCFCTATACPNTNSRWPSGSPVSLATMGNPVFWSASHPTFCPNIVNMNAPAPPW